jgi:hypothetical protein
VSLSLEATRTIDGFIRANLINGHYGIGLMSEPASNDEADSDAESATMSETFAAGQRALRSIGQDPDYEDVVVTRDGEYHVLHPLEHVPEVFVHIVLSRETAHLAEARHQLAEISRDVAHELSA